MTEPAKGAEAKSAVVRVGDGRGFFVDGPNGPVVTTAAHCLPSFPPCMSASYVEERTYKAILGSLEGEPTVWAECLFVDPIADIALLGPPDHQALPKEYFAYDAFAKVVAALTFAEAPMGLSPAWLLSLDGRWFRCVARHAAGSLWLDKAEEDIRGGMSGSPMIAADGTAVGVLCTSSDHHGSSRSGGPNPSLHNLPGWFIRARRKFPLAVRASTKAKRYKSPPGARFTTK